jgi:superfamily II DNA/RNA helicase
MIGMQRQRMCHENLDYLVNGFNSPKCPPYILVASDVLSEGVDLQYACKLLIHYELPWSPLRLFQRVGRLTRRKGRLGFNRNVRVAHVIIPGSVEEERVNRLTRRISFLSEQNLWPSQKPPLDLATALFGSGPSLHLEELCANEELR